MSGRAELLERERRKLEWLRGKVAEQEQRVHMLEQDDPLDEMFERELTTSGTSAVPAASQAQQEPRTTRVWNDLTVSWKRRPRRLAPGWAKLLKYIGREGKTFREVEAFLSSENLGISPGAARTGLMTYRRDYEFVESPRKGFYIVTDAALEFIKTQEGESPTTDNGGASVSQPTPSDRAAA